MTQSSAKGIVNWSAFSIGQGATVQFDNGAGATLNRVTGAAGSLIDGLLSGTGSVYLLNSNGVVVGKTGLVNVGGSFVASTLGLSDGAFLAGGPLTFSGPSTASVTNLGQVGSLGGDVALIAATVSNAGTISAPQGSAGLASGGQVTLSDASLDGGRFSVSLPAQGGSLTNSGLIAAASVELRASGGDIYALAGDTAGVIRATGVSVGGGRIWLVAEGGGLTVAGTLHAEDADGTGGQVETSGAQVRLGGASISTGQGGAWLIDPVDLTVDTTAAATIARSLATTNVTLQTTAVGTSGPGVQNPNGNGDITVAAPISWASANGLTLSALRNVNVNAGLTSSGVGGVTLYADNAGTGVGTVAFGGGSKVSTSGAVDLYYNPANNQAGSAINATSYTNPTSYAGSVTGRATLTAYMLVNTLNDLQDVENNLTGAYALGRNIDASPTAKWNSGAGFLPIASTYPGFTGTFDGQGHSISTLSINRTQTPAFTGLFAVLGTNGVIRNVSLIGGSVSGAGFLGSAQGAVGSLLGLNEGGSIINVSTSTQVTGSNDYAGGLVGWNEAGSIASSTTSGRVNGQTFVGGLTGSNSGAITNASATGTVVASGSGVGGLVGINNGSISGSFASTSVNGSAQFVGGLVGENSGNISSSYASGLISGSTAGGLVGANTGFINDAYSVASVNLIAGFGGGLIGQQGGGTIINVYATGRVQGTGSGLGGLLGFLAGGTVTNGYWDIGQTGRSVAVGFSDGGSTSNVTGLGGSTGLSPYAQASYGGFDFGATWFILPGQTRPLLRSEYSTTITNGHQLQLIDLNVGASYVLGADVDLSGTSATAEVWAGGFAPIGVASGSSPDLVFAGSLDGQGHVLQNLGISAPGLSSAGLFSVLAPSATVRNITFANASITGGGFVGVVAGRSAGTVINVQAIGSGLLGTSYVGGLIGSNSGAVSQSSSNAYITGTGYVGGLIGDNSGVLTSDSAAGTINGRGGTGGLIGVNEGGAAVTGSSSSAKVTGTGADVGGLIGASFASVSGATASGAVSGGDHTGGLIGYNSGAVSGSTATGAVTGTNYTGGLVGLNYAAVSGSHATGAVNGTQYVGGLVGWNTRYGAIDGSDAAGSVVDGGGYAGGLVGVNQNTITNSRALAGASVSGSQTVGGLVGLNQGAIANASAADAVTGNLDVGGLVGWNDTGATISQAFATGAVSGRVGRQEAGTNNDYVGGLVGVNYGQIANTYATGKVSGVQVVGGLVGTNMPGGASVSASYATGLVTATMGAVGSTFGVQAGTVTSVYGFSSLSGQARESGYYNAGASGDGTDLTTAQQDGSDAYTGFDFTKTWRANANSAPTLQNAPGQ